MYLLRGCNTFSVNFFYFLNHQPTLLDHIDIVAIKYCHTLMLENPNKIGFCTKESQSQRDHSTSINSSAIITTSV